MPSVSYQIEKKRIEAEERETILQVSLRSGISHAHACGGHARCSTCRILIVEGVDHCAPRNEKEQALAERLHFTPDIRLACQTTISDDVKVRRLVIDEEDLQLANQLTRGAVLSAVGEEKKLAVLFSDIRGFTPFAEALPPYDVVHVLNRYFHQMGRVITSFGGNIDNYAGDGLMALFGMNDSVEAPLHAVKAGLGMLEAVERLRPYLEAIHCKSFQIGIGIHYGEVVVGEIGAENLKRVTAIGDAVNLASRIESANKQSGTRLLISEETYNEVKGRVNVGRTIRISLPGKSGEYSLYEVTGLSKAGC
ncbi:MAG TPA: adenylate/guanylate cyclase domain-containing protein [Blastocatellia bacterium]|nr:adenylate/guanylate cyclase domain-containing protein [Blastocatellia bacterium]